MGDVKHLCMEFIEASYEASYEEAQSRLRLSTLCKACVRPLAYSLFPRIVELAIYLYT